MIKTTPDLFMKPRHTLHLLICLSGLTVAQGQEINPFDKASEVREKLRQKAEKDRRPSPTLPLSPSAKDGFDQAADRREAARQRAFDRGQRTALPAQEERESIGRMVTPAANAPRAADGSVVKQGPPAAAVYNRVMETRRHFQHYQDPFLWNVNDSFTDKPEDRAKFEQEALRIYPELSQPQSPVAMRHAEIVRWLDTRLPPLARDARRQLLVAHMVSLELHHYLRGDRFGLGQVPRIHRFGQRPPAFIKRNNFIVEVVGTDLLLPDGLKGKVIRGKDGQPDLLDWLDGEGRHQIWVPQEPQGRVEFFTNHYCDYRRQELQGGNYRILFTKP